MSGIQFLETLRQLGYLGTDKLDPQMFDWLFERENIVPFLDWFSTSVHSNNIITPNEREEYEELKKKDTGLLEGRQLEEALKYLTVTNTESNITEESLSDDVSRLSRELEENEEKKQLLIQRRNRLSVHHTNLCHKVTKLTPLESRSKQQYCKQQEQLQSDNNKVNNSMEKLMTSIQRVTSLYDEPTKSSDNKDCRSDPVFLAHVNLDDYFHTTEKYSQEVTSFTRKQFFQSIGKMTGENDGSRFKLLEIKDPESLLVHGEKDKTIIEDCKELSRLQSVYVRSETEKIYAMLESKGLTAAINTAEDIVKCLQDSDFPIDMNVISTQLQESQSSLQNIKRDLANILEGDLPMLLRELSPLQGTQILTGDYNLKLARQDYFTSNQDKLIKLLISQKARHDFLIMAHEVEARHHRDIHRLLTAVRLQLHKHLEDWKNRTTVMDDPALKSSKYQRGTIDTRDASTSRIYQMLDDSSECCSEKQLFLTYNNLVEGGEKLHQCHQSTHIAMMDTATRYYDKLHKLEGNLKQCEETVYKGSSTISGQPTLSSPQLQQTIKQLDDVLEKLEATFKTNWQHVSNRKQALKNDVLLSREKTFFVDFFTNPQRLQQAIDKLSSRFQASNVH